MRGWVKDEGGWVGGASEGGGGEVLFALRSVGDVSQRALKVGLATPSQFGAGGVSRG